MADKLDLDANGRILVPTNPETARIRLRELEADPAYMDAILDQRHPLHEIRTSERQALLRFASAGNRPV